MDNIISLIIRFLKINFLNLKEQITEIPIYLIFIFFGFLLGNLFGILTSSLFSDFNNSALANVLILLIVIEIITVFKYGYSQKLKNRLFLILNLFKRGFLIGIFLEAFKVGS